MANKKLDIFLGKVWEDYISSAKESGDMVFNPIEFGEKVIEQYNNYLVPSDFIAGKLAEGYKVGKLTKGMSAKKLRDQGIIKVNDIDLVIRAILEKKVKELQKFEEVNES